MYTIAHRTFLDDVRKRKRNRVQLTKDGTLQAEPAADLTGVPVEAGQDEAARPDAAATAGALAALEQLPENQRQALLLTKVHGRSTTEAAMIAGTTPGAIKQRAHRAYVTLREMLAKPAPPRAGPADRHRGPGRRRRREHQRLRRARAAARPGRRPAPFTRPPERDPGDAAGPHALAVRRARAGRAGRARLAGRRARAPRLPTGSRRAAARLGDRRGRPLGRRVRRLADRGAGPAARRRPPGARERLARRQPARCWPCSLHPVSPPSRFPASAFAPKTRT